MKQGKPQHLMVSQGAMVGGILNGKRPPMVVNNQHPLAKSMKANKPRHRANQPVFTKQNITGFVKEGRAQPFTAEQIAANNAEIERKRMQRRAAKKARHDGR